MLYVEARLEPLAQQMITAPSVALDQRAKERDVFLFINHAHQKKRNTQQRTSNLFYSPTSLILCFEGSLALWLRETASRNGKLAASRFLRQGRDSALVS